MKTLRKMKKGFTIVELVIVIAVIAVLTAILVPTFISISNKANEASDKSLVKNLNTALRMAEGKDGKNETMHDAVLDVEEYAGIKLSQFVSKSGDEILWDSVTDEFVWKTAKPEGRADHLLWTIAKSYDSSAQTFSMYAGHEWTVTSVAGLKVGLDVGFHEDVESIEYVGTGSAKTVTIRTYGGTLSINAPTDTVKRFGYLEHLNVIAVSTLASYHEFGFLKKLDNFGSGHFVAEATAEFEESREALLTTIGSNTSNLGTLPDDHFGVEDPYKEPEAIEVTQANYKTVLSDNPTEVYFKLTEKIEVDSIWYLWGSGSDDNRRDIVLDLNGKNIVSSEQDAHCNIFDIQYTNLTLKNGGIINNNTPASYDTLYCVVGGSCSLTCENVSFSGAAIARIGVMSGTITLRFDGECQMNDGYISAFGTSIVFECEGTFKVSSPGYSPTMILSAPTVSEGEGYTKTYESPSWMEAPDLELEFYKVYTFAKN